MNIKFDSLGRRLNTCVQMLTTVTQINQDNIDISDTGEPQYMEEGDRPVHIFKDNDYLTYRSFDPKAYAEYKKNQKTPDTQRNADKLNPVINQ